MSAAVGDSISPGGALYSISSQGRVVQVSLAEEDRDLAVVKAPVVIDAGSAGTAEGSISAVQAVTSSSSSGQGGGGDSSTTTTYLVTIGVDSAKKGSAAAKGARVINDQPDGSPVSVSFAEKQAKDVLSVPIKALLALAEGGYGVERVNPDGASTIIAVQTGLFANGQVEVTSEGLAEGDTVRAAR